MQKKFLALFVGALLLFGVANASTISRQHVFTSGSQVRALYFNDEFDALVDGHNGQETILNQILSYFSSSMLNVANGGTGASTATGARTNLSAAKSGANSDITSLSGLTTALSATQGGTGLNSVTGNKLLYSLGLNSWGTAGIGTGLQVDSGDLKIVDNSSTQKINVYNNGSLVGTRKSVNLVPGTNVSYSISDSSLNDRVDVTINASSTASLPRGHLSGLILSNNTTDANNDIDITEGAARSSDNTGDITLATGVTKQLDAAFVAGTNAGCLDTGTKANSTTYHVFAIRSVSATDILCSTSVSSPTMPSGFTLKRRIGSIITDASGNLRGFFQDGDDFFYKSPPLDVNTTASTTAASVTLITPSGIKLIALVNALVTAGSGGTVYISSLDSDDVAASTSAAPLGSIGWASSSDLTAVQMRVRTNISSAVRVRSAGASTTLRISTVGWTDKRGRFD